MRYMNGLTGREWSKKAEEMTKAAKLGFGVHFLPKKGITLAKIIIVLGKKRSPAVELAARDLESYFRKSCSGLSVKLINENNLSAYEKRCHLIVIGNEKENSFLKDLKRKLKMGPPLKFPDRYYEMTEIRMADSGQGFLLLTYA